MQLLGATYFSVIFNIWQSILYCCELYSVYKYSQAAAAASTSISRHCKKKSAYKYPVKAFLFFFFNFVLLLIQYYTDYNVLYIGFVVFPKQNSSILLQWYQFLQKDKNTQRGTKHI